MTAAEKLMMLSERALYALFLSHMKLRLIMQPQSVTPDRLEAFSNDLRRLAWHMNRRNTDV